MMPEVQDILADETFIGDPLVFAIGYTFLGNDRVTEISMWANGTNLLGFIKNNEHLTTRWAYLEGVAAWLNSFVHNMADDPFPIEAEGEFAAEKDAHARNQLPDLDDGCSDEEMDEFDARVDLFDDWSWNHTWLSERAGAILSNVFFEYKDGMVELSWNNRNVEDGVMFDCEFGGTRVDAETFRSVVLEFVDTYEQHWGIKVDDDNTWRRRA